MFHDDEPGGTVPYAIIPCGGGGQQSHNCIANSAEVVQEEKKEEPFVSWCLLLAITKCPSFRRLLLLLFWVSYGVSMSIERFLSVERTTSRSFSELGNTRSQKDPHSS